MRDATRARRGGLPATADLFVGRDGEMAALSGMLGDVLTGLVTLTGPPGIGKTRLAVACAEAYAERTGWATAFVDLAQVRDPARVLVELAQAVGVEPRSDADLAGQLGAATGNEDLLVVLDNFEHLLAAARDVGRVLASCQRLLVLVTSRERLRLSAEHEFPVPPLAVPDPAEVGDLACLSANPSVALLVDRARRTNPHFTLTAANAALVAGACVRLEGLPLAIELAAARLKALSPGELVFRLGSRMEVLAGTTRDVPARQRALRTAIAWSYDLLDPDERFAQPLIEHWNGRAWKSVSAPSPSPSVPSWLTGVTVISASDAWAVGSYGTTDQHTLIEHWNGKSWRRVRSPSPGLSAVLVGVASSRTSIWAVGYYNSGGSAEVLAVHCC